MTHSKKVNLLAALLTAFFLFWGGRIQAADLTILTENSPPGNFLAPSGELRGLGVDIVREIMKRLDIHTPIRVLPWARAYRMLLRTPDIMVFSTSRSEEREHQFKWVGPLFRVNWSLVESTRHPVHISSLSGAKALRRIGVYRDDVKEQYLRARGFTNLYAADNSCQLLNMLEKKRLDLVAMTANSQSPQCGFSKAEWNRRFNTVYTRENIDLYMAFSKQTDDNVVAQWQRIFNELDQEGFIEATRDKWLKSSEDWY